MAVFMIKKRFKKSSRFYNLSLKTNSKDSYLIASNYRNLGNMYFRNAAYPAAAKYYDSTLVRLTTNRESIIKFKKLETISMK
jgi:hypothetical protein